MPLSSQGAYGTVDIGATAAVIRAGSIRQGIIIQNTHASQILYVGLDDSVTTSTGLRISAGEALSIDNHAGPIYGIASGASTTVRYFEVGS